MALMTEEEFLSGGQSSLMSEEDFLSGEKPKDNRSDLEKMRDNIIPSAIQYGSNIVDMFAHPIDTFTNIGNLAEGTLQKLVPGTQGKEVYADLVGKALKERYWDNPWQSMVEDPTGMALDVAGLAAGGASLVGKVGGVSKATKAANIINKLDPTNAIFAGIDTPAFKVAGKAVESKHIPGIADAAGFAANKVADVVGANVGVGGQGLGIVIDNYKDALKGIRGQVSPTQVASDSDKLFNAVKEMKRKDYLDNMAKVQGWDDAGDIAPIQQALANTQQNYKPIKGRDGKIRIEQSSAGGLGADAKADLVKMYEEIDDWRNTQGNKFSPRELDGLKKRIDAIYSDNSDVNYVLAQVRKSIADTIESRAPGYGEAMKDYQEFLGIERDLKQTLSLGNKKTSVDTKFKKVASTMRDNMETRRAVLDKTRELGLDPDSILAQAAGIQMQTAMPRGLSGRTVGGVVGIGGGVAVSPWLLTLAASSSPRLVGETLIKVGWTKAQVNKLLSTKGFKELQKTVKYQVGTTQGRTASSAAGRYNELVEKELK